MHTLTFVRHGKSDAPISVADKSRTLNAQGMADVLKMAHRLKDAGYQPNRIISSDATRAVMTAEILVGIFGAPVTYESVLYNATEQAVIDLLTEVDDTIEHLMIIGHNPTWEALVHYLSGDFQVMYPGAVVQLELLSSWNELKENVGKVLYYDYPQKV